MLGKGVEVVLVNFFVCYFVGVFGIVVVFLVIEGVGVGWFLIFFVGFLVLVVVGLFVVIRYG